MAKVNLGGPMPDGSRAQDMWADQGDFVCASGAMLSEGPFKNLLGKLCLTRTSFVMLPYEGAALKVVQELAKKLKKSILGPYADMAGKLEQLGLYAKGPEVLDRVLVWPLAELDGPAIAEDRSLFFIKGGADFIVSFKGEKYSFNMRTKGYEMKGFASAQFFRDSINHIRGY